MTKPGERLICCKFHTAGFAFIFIILLISATLCAAPGKDAPLIADRKLGWNFENNSISGFKILSGNVAPISNRDDRKYDKEGNFFLTTGRNVDKENDDSIVCELRSPVFTIKTNYLSMLIGGGHDNGRLIVSLTREKDDVPVFYFTGSGDENMIRRIVNISHLEGELFYIKILDNSDAPMGHLNVDDIRFFDIKDMRDEEKASRKKLEIWFDETAESKKASISASVSYSGKNLRNIAMPLGGIGAGQVSLRGDGSFGSWEIFNRICRHNFNNDCFFAIRTSINDESFLKNNKGKYRRVETRGLPRTSNYPLSEMRDITFTNEYPLGVWLFRDKNLPVDITLEAFSPFIPGDLENSSLPAAVMKFKIKNKINAEISASLLGNMQNMVGHLGLSGINRGKSADLGWNKNTLKTDASSSRIFMSAKSGEPDILKREKTVVSMDVEAANLFFPMRGARFIEREIRDRLSEPAAQRQNDIYIIREAKTILSLSNEQKNLLLDSIKNGASLIISGDSKMFSQIKDFCSFGVKYDCAADTDSLSFSLPPLKYSDPKAAEKDENADKPASVSIKNAAYFVNAVYGENVRQMLSLDKDKPAALLCDYHKGKAIFCAFDIAEKNTGVSARLLAGYMLSLLGGEEFTLSSGLADDAPGAGSMEFSVLDPKASSVAQVYHIASAMKDFVKDGKLKFISSKFPSPRFETWNASFASEITLAPNEEKEITFVLTWNFPNHYWRFRYEKDWLIGNNYTNRFKDAAAVSDYVISNLEYLEKETKKFSRALRDSTLPQFITEAVGSTLAIMNSPVFIYPKNGGIYSWEGRGYIDGTCSLNCTHVMQYSQAPAFLFSDIASDFRKTDYHYQQKEDGGIRYRLDLPLDAPRGSGAIVDGQIGVIIQTYREYLLSTDTSVLKSDWQKIKAAILWLFKEDPDADGIIESPQFTTFDWTLEGINPMVGFGYLSALEASRNMAAAVGDSSLAEEAGARFIKGREKLEGLLWDDKRSHFIQRLPADKKIDYQIENGCLSVQLQGVFWQRLLGLDEFVSKEKVAKTLLTIFEKNWKSDLSAYPSKEKTRFFASGSEKGLINCSWKSGETPEKPFPYSDEVWSGFEYLFASMLIREGLVDEGLFVARGARERYDGIWRNPFADEETGNFYIRALSSYDLILSSQGFIFDLPDGLLGFTPKMTPGKHKSFFSYGKCWGIFSQERTVDSQRESISILHGELEINKMIFAAPQSFAPANISVKHRRAGQAADEAQRIDSTISPMDFSVKPSMTDGEKPIRIMLSSAIHATENDEILVDIFSKE